MTTQIDLLPLVTLAVSASLDGDLYVPIAFRDANNAPIDQTGIAYALALKTGTGKATVAISLASSGSPPTIVAGGVAGSVTLLVPQARWSRVADGRTYVGDLVASADGKTIVVGEMTVTQKPIGGCAVTSFKSVARNAATAGSVGYIPGPAWNQYKGNYSSIANYVGNDVVYYNFSTWIALGPVTGQAPVTGSAYWALVAPGVDPTALNNATTAATNAQTAAAASAAAAAGYSTTAGSAAASTAADAATATTQAGIATSQASTATTQAGIATTKAGNAATSETNAAAYAAAAAASAASVNPLPGFRNRFANGDMRIDQRRDGAAQTLTAAAALAYTVDRWYAYCTGANVTGQRGAGAYVFSGAAGVTGIGFGQRIAAAECADLAGTTARLSVDLSNSLLTTVTWTAYYANSTDSFGTLASPTRTLIATGTFTVNSSLTRYSVSLSVPSAATTGIEIVFSVGAQTSGAWFIGRAQFEPGVATTTFEALPVSVQELRCRRTFRWVPLNLSGYSNGAGAVTGSSVVFDMRTTPTAGAALADPNTSQAQTNVSSANISVISPSSAFVNILGAASGGSLMTGYRFALSAEL